MTSSVDKRPDRQEDSSALFFSVEGRQVGIRLDHFLVQVIPEISRAVLISSIRSGKIRVNDLEKKSSYKLKEGDVVAGQIAVEPTLHLEPEEIPLQILFEDEYLLALSKPPGLVVHPGNGNRNGTLVNGLIHHCHAIATVGDDIRPGIVHRLDKDTSGVMLVAKDEKILRLLAADFKNRRIEKEYIALVHGLFSESQGRIVAPIGRHQVHRQKMAVQEITGRHAATNWRVIKEFEGRLALLAIRIETGRTHQIRVHMSHIGHPVAGDLIYGARHQDHRFIRQMLHAARLGFVHPVTKEHLEIVAPLWADFLQVIETLAGGIPAELEGLA
jgi:23S rRNA pseudouridine1911/1915/1917 synthase